jgi:hypothetical protein
MSEGIVLWAGILVPSAIIGVVCGYFIKGRPGIILAGAVPWFGLLFFLLYHEYFVPYQGGGASMWPIAQLFAGTMAAGTGIGACLLCRIILKRKNNTSQQGTAADARTSRR